MTELCCSEPLPVLSADGSNTINCANCGAKYVHQTEEYEKALLALLNLTATANTDTTRIVSAFKSLPDDTRVHMFAGYILDSCIRLLYGELMEQEPETRNRMSLSIESPEGEYTLSLAKGKYNNVMEDQRNEARGERDALRLLLDSMEKK